MVKAKKDESIEDVVVEKKPVDAIVVSASGEFIRTYSLENHGKDFKALAEQFAKKIGGKVS